MSNPGLDAAKRAAQKIYGSEMVRSGMAAAAWEALMPIREFCEGMREMFGDDFEIHIDDLATMIYTSEELS